MRQEGQNGQKGEDKMGGSDFSLLPNTHSLMMSFHGEVLERINMAPYITA